MICRMRRSRPTDDGRWEHAEPPCSATVAYAVTIDFADGLGPVSFRLCPEHTAWARASLSGVIHVRQESTL